MKRIIVGISMALFLVSSAFGQVNWKMDPAHSEIQFKVKHLVITTVTGEFKDYDISFTSRKVDNFDNADLRVAIRTGSIFTDNEKRDEHLRSDDFLNAEAYPEIRFVAA